MKKFLLSAAALVTAMSVNAQVIQINAEEVGVDPTDANYGDKGINVEAGKVWAENDALKVCNAFETSHKKVDCKCNDLTKVIIDGNEIITSGGIQGQDNPKDEDGGNSALTLKPAVGGAVIQLDAKKDGWVYIVAKLSTNKQYMVFEEGAAMGYKIAMAVLGSKDEFKEIAAELVPTGILNLEIKGEGEYNYIPASVAQPDGPGIQWVIREYTGDIEAASAGDGLGVFYFPVAEGCTYLAHATGSKISWSGIYFSETEAKSVIAEGDGISMTLIGEGGDTPEPVTFDVWTVAGGSNLMGSDWNTADTNNDMTSTDGVTYTLVKEGVVLEKGVTYEFKVAKDHAWTEAYPGNNATLTVEETATYTVTFTFNADSKEVSAATEKTGEAVVGEKTYSVIGTINGNWDNDTDMTWNEENQKYTAEFENVAAGKYEFKVRVNHDWAECYGTDGNNYVLELDNNATYVLITFDPETKGISTIIVDGGDEPAGNTVLWDTETAFDSWSATIVIEAEKFANVKAGDIIRVSYKDKGSDYNPIYKHVDDWSDWTDFQNAINKDNEGYFEAPVTEDAIAELQSKGLRFQGVGFTLTKVELISDASAINSVKKATKANGAIYNIAGQKVNASYKGLVIKNGKKYIQK